VAPAHPKQQNAMSGPHPPPQKHTPRRLRYALTAVARTEIRIQAFSLQQCCNVFRDAELRPVVNHQTRLSAEPLNCRFLDGSRHAASQDAPNAVACAGRRTGARPTSHEPNCASGHGLRMMSASGCSGHRDGGKIGSQRRAGESETPLGEQARNRFEYGPVELD
jgi:hypothetical protein